jgi:acetyltransferase-like isoleucine patch superfamily enzyme
MRKYQDKSPDQVMRLVTTEIIERAIKMGKKKGRDIRISKTSRGEGVSVDTRFLKRVARSYTISGLGRPEEKNAINWRKLNVPTGRRLLLFVQVCISMVLRGSPGKIRFYRRMGVHIGQNTEIMQAVWLDHFRPELIFIGDNTLIGAFSRVTVHAYEGGGRFRFGLVEIGNHCTLAAGTGLGVVKMEDHVRTLPGTTVSPYLVRVREGSVVGWNPPHVQLPEATAD